MAGTRITKDWLKANALDPIYRTDAMIDVWLDLAVSTILEWVQCQVDDLTVAMDVEECPEEWLDRLRETIGGLGGTKLGTPAYRQQLRHSMELFRLRGSPECVRVVFALNGLRVELAELWLDRGHRWPTGRPLIGMDNDVRQLAEIVNNDTFDDPVRTFDDGWFFDASVVRRYDIPAAYLTEFSGQLYGKTTFLVVNVLADVANPGAQEMSSVVMRDYLPVLLPLHVRLIGMANYVPISEPLVGDYGEWTGFGYGYGAAYDGEGYAYGSWTFEHRGSLVGLADEISALVDEGELDDGYWDDGGWMDLDPEQWYMTMDEGEWDDGGIFDNV